MYFKEGEQISGCYKGNKITLEKFDYLIIDSVFQYKYIISTNREDSRWVLSAFVKLLKTLVSHPIRLIVFILFFPLFFILFFLMIILSVSFFFRPKKFKYTLIVKDDIHYQGFYLPNFMVFSDSDNIGDSHYNYYIAKIDQKLYLKKLPNEHIDWADRAERYLDVTDNATIKKIEQTFSSVFESAVQRKNERTKKEQAQSNHNEQRQLSDQEKQNFMSLAKYCLSEEGQGLFQEKLDTYMTDAAVEETPWMVLYDLMIPYNEDNFHFATQLDWKEGVDELEYGLERVVRFNFGLNLTLPTQGYYNEMDSISSNENIFKDFNAVLNPYGLKLGNIDTGADEYMIIVYKIADENKVKKAVENIAYELVTF
ncbi:DUF6630 family protein [Neisseria sp. Ec49-e6-T10]|uniref:DUF6630 family protein n=1 Tax=Neisseria sp. Ec49-e6-T10 TaxID=3140744 RepID=UPI003EB952B8